MGAVELRVAEARSVGRYYGLTEAGSAVWDSVKGSVRTIRWSVEEPDSKSQAVLDAAKDEFGEALRIVGTYDDDEFAAHYVGREAYSEYSAETLEEILCTLFFDNPLDKLRLPNNDCRSETVQFEDFVVIRVRPDAERRILISFEEPRNVSIPEFSERILSLFEG